MSVLATTNPTLLDLAKRLDPDGSVAQIVEILNSTEEILHDMAWMEGNLPTGHRTTVRTGIPMPTWRSMYQGVQPVKSTTAQITDNCGMLENYGEVDKALADLNGNTAAFRISEDAAIIEGFSQTVAKTVFYGNEGADPAMFTGLAPRFNERTISLAASGDNIIHGGGSSSDNTSIWLVVWSPRTVCGIFPKGSKVGLQMTDKGQVTIESAPVGGGRMEAYRTHFRWDCGLCVRDWRYVVRIANISVGALTKDAQSGADLVDLMKQATYRVPSLAAGRAVFYANRDIMSFLDRQMTNHKNVNISVKEVGDTQTLLVGRIPVKRCDALLNNEAVVPAT